MAWRQAARHRAGVALASSLGPFGPRSTGDAPRRWAHAMHTYHFVALGVAPKKAKLAEAQAELEEATGVLNEARAKLAAVVEKLEKLEEALNAAVNEKKSLSDKEQQCKVRLSNADKLIGGLGADSA